MDIQILNKMKLLVANNMPKKSYAKKRNGLVAAIDLHSIANINIEYFQ